MGPAAGAGCRPPIGRAVSCAWWFSLPCLPCTLVNASHLHCQEQLLLDLVISTHELQCIGTLLTVEAQDRSRPYDYQLVDGR